MEIEYSGRYAQLRQWAKRLEHLANAVTAERDSEILVGVRLKIIDITNLLYERLGQLQKEADAVAEEIDKVEAYRNEENEAYYRDNGESTYVYSSEAEAKVAADLGTDTGDNVPFPPAAD